MLLVFELEYRVFLKNQLKLFSETIYSHYMLLYKFSKSPTTHGGNKYSVVIVCVLSADILLSSIVYLLNCITVIDVFLSSEEKYYLGTVVQR